MDQLYPLAARGKADVFHTKLGALDSSALGPGSLKVRKETHNRLNDIRKVISHGNEQGSLFRIVGADLIDPAQN